MSKLVYTSNTPIDLADWSSRTDIMTVSAGRNCVVAILKDKTILKKQLSNDSATGNDSIYELDARDRFFIRNDRSERYLSQLSLAIEAGWKDIEQVAVSQFLSSVIIGRRSDGSCVIHVERDINEDCGRAVIAAGRVSNWSRIIDVAVSDAIFAVDELGKAHHYAFYVPDEYHAVDNWENVNHIVTGVQNAVFGITNDGRVLCAGSNCSRNLQNKMNGEKDVIDICLIDPESNQIILLHRDGSISSLSSKSIIDNNDSPYIKRLFGYYYNSFFVLTKENELIPVLSMLGPDDEEMIARWKDVRSFSMGQKHFSKPFAIAVIE